MKRSIPFILLFALCVSVLCITAKAEVSAALDSEVFSLTVQTYPGKTVYGAFETFDSTGLRLKAVYESGEEKIVNRESVEISYQNDDCFRVGDSGVILSYGGQSVELPVTVNRISYDLSALLLENFAVTYNGKYQSYNEMLPDIIGLDGIPLIMSAVGGSTNAGTYDIKIDFFSESIDYVVPDTRVVTMTILPLEVDAIWSGSAFVYDGKSKLPEAYYFDVNGNKIYPTVTGAAINAGKYTATAVVGDPNYKLNGASISYEIGKADYDFSSVVWSRDSFIYDGSKKSITLSGLPDGVSVIGYSSDRATNAGVYTVTASLSYDERNYNPPPELSHTWKINPAEYDMSMTHFVDTECVFDGRIHYPELEGRMPTGADGIKLECVFSGGAESVSDGIVVVTVSFTTKSKNYVLPESQIATVRILPCGIYVNWGETSLSYNGEKQYPNAVADKCEILLRGGGTNVGKYTAIAYTKDRNYYVINDRVDFEIKKATNLWITNPQNSLCYEGKGISISGEPKFGKASYIFYSDKEGRERISAPSSAGIYYAKIFVPETDNYSGLESKIILFEIIKIAPVSFSAMIEREHIKAFEMLSINDFICYITNNDGSTESVDPTNVGIIYENGDSFRRSDSVVTLVYKDFKIDIPVDVDYADYDLSKVKWENVTVEYDGTWKSPNLSGLPEGITVLEYSGGGVIDAGKYTVRAVVRYDGENYNEPVIPECSFEITKCIIPTPTIRAVYNGKEQIPVSDSPLYRVENSKSYKDAGNYVFSATIIDPKNYTFADGEGNSCQALFVIEPKTVSVKIENIKKYLFEKVGQAVYTIQTEDLIEGDTITVTQYIVDGYVFCKSENPNYSLAVTPGRINRLWYPSARGWIAVIIVIISLCLVICAAFAIYIFRHRIASACAVLRCRWHNRAVSIFPPRDASPDKSVEYTDYSETDYDVASLFPEEEEYVQDYADTDDEPISNEEEQFDYESHEGDEVTENQTVSLEVDVERADELITDSLAKSLLKKEGDCIYTSGNAKCIINVDTLSESFAAGDRVDVNSLKDKGLVPPDTAYLKVLARGSIDKPLSVLANDFSLSAVKMIALTGGEAKRVITLREKTSEE